MRQLTHLKFHIFLGMPEPAHALAKSSIVETKGIEPSTSCLRRPRLPRLAGVISDERRCGRDSKLTFIIGQRRCGVAV